MGHVDRKAPLDSLGLAGLARSRLQALEAVSELGTHPVLGPHVPGHDREPRDEPAPFQTRDTVRPASISEPSLRTTTISRYSAGARGPGRRAHDALRGGVSRAVVRRPAGRPRTWLTRSRRQP